MLTQRDKIHLQQLLSLYTFQHLEPPSQVHSIVVPEEEHFMHIDEKTKLRKIYYKVKYSEEQEKAIEKVKESSLEAGIFQNFPRQIILKHLYASSMKEKDCLQRLLQVQAYLNNSKITTLTKSTIDGLQSGCAYTYGHDKNLKPNVIIRADKFDYSKPFEENMNIVYFLIIVVLGFRNVPFHAEKYNCLFDCNNMNLKDIPYKYLYEVMKAMGLYYYGNVEKSFVLNAKGVEPIWMICKRFLPQYARSRIKFITEDNKNEIFDYINSSQLEKRYGGDLSNLKQFWPPKMPNKIEEQVKMRKEVNTEESFYSIYNDIEYFKENQQTLCGSQACACRIF